MARLADALEREPTAVPMFPGWSTVELLGPVGLEPMTIETRVGLAESARFDRHGRIGHSAQILLIDTPLINTA